MQQLRRPGTNLSVHCGHIAESSQIRESRWCGPCTTAAPLPHSRASRPPRAPPCTRCLQSRASRQLTGTPIAFGRGELQSVGVGRGEAPSPAEILLLGEVSTAVLPMNCLHCRHWLHAARARARATEASAAQQVGRGLHCVGVVGGMLVRCEGLGFGAASAGAAVRSQGIVRDVWPVPGVVAVLRPCMQGRDARSSGCSCTSTARAPERRQHYALARL